MFLLRERVFVSECGDLDSKFASGMVPTMPYLANQRQKQTEHCGGMALAVRVAQVPWNLQERDVNMQRIPELSGGTFRGRPGAFSSLITASNVPSSERARRN